MLKFIPKSALIGTAILFAGSMLHADAKDDVKAGAKKLADQSSYSWKQSTENAGGNGGGNGRGRMGPTEGKLEKGGWIYVVMTRGDNTTEAVINGKKGAIKTQDGWKSLEEAAADDGSGQFNFGRFLARSLQNYKTPAMTAEEIADGSKDLKAADDAIAGDLTEDGAKALMRFGGRGGNNGPEISNAKGTVKFWLKDGILNKVVYHVQGTISFNGNDREIDRTTTIDIKDIGQTKVEIPEEAKKKAE